MINYKLFNFFKYHSLEIHHQQKMKKIKYKTGKVLRCYEVYFKTKIEKMEKHTFSQITKIQLILQKCTHKKKFYLDLDRNLHKN